MTITPDEEALQTSQREVQRLLGRCLLRIQQYERLIKAIVAGHEMCGPASRINEIRTARAEAAATKTLGTLVGKLLGSYVVSGPGGDVSVDDPVGEERATFGLRFQLSMGAEDYARTQKELAELVMLRNSLVHHFIDQHDLWTLDGCLRARAALEANYRQIDGHCEQLRTWAGWMEETRRQAAEFAQSSAFHELVVNGIHVDGSVHWPHSGAVLWLRQVAAEFAVDGWVPIHTAGRAIQSRAAEQVPAKYGCTTWKQVVHNSGQFDLQYRQIDGQPVACYRERAARA